MDRVAWQRGRFGCSSPSTKELHGGEVVVAKLPEWLFLATKSPQIRSALKFYTEH